jgi:hypothetical protein
MCSLRLLIFTSMSLILLLLTLVVSVCHTFQVMTGSETAHWTAHWRVRRESVESPREDFLGAGPQDDPDFFISKWTPQAELLQDPAVKAVITHCGWGGTLESWLALLAPHLFSFPFHRLPLLSFFS